MRDNGFPYLPKDFIQTHEGLIFAVVSYLPQADKVGCFLRYIPQGKAWVKVGTDQANALLAEEFPHYLFHSQQFDSSFHAVTPRQIAFHHKPEDKLRNVLTSDANDPITLKLQTLIPLLHQRGMGLGCLGLTGSMLIDQHKPGSDIDLVVYGRSQFHLARKALALAIDDGVLSGLDDELMRDNFQRRAGELSYDEFAWHEYRKFNKAAIDGTKFDIGMTCLGDEIEQDEAIYQKQGIRTFETTVIDDQRSFDFPAVYIVDDSEIAQVVSYTHTYVGQAMVGERIRVSGVVEKNTVLATRRLIVGSSREASGEYIKVIGNERGEHI